MVKHHSDSERGNPLFKVIWYQTYGKRPLR